MTATVALSGTANAAACSGLTGLAGSCTTTGTVTITAGGLTVGAPASLTWAAAITGAAQTIYDTSGRRPGARLRRRRLGRGQQRFLHRERSKRLHPG